MALHFQPAQIYIKIPNLSTFTHTRICYIVCCKAYLFSSSGKFFLFVKSECGKVSLVKVFLVRKNGKCFRFCLVKVFLVRILASVFATGLLKANLDLLPSKNVQKFQNCPAKICFTTDDAMASAGLNCCSTVCQHKCI